MTSSIFLPSTPPAALISSAFSLAPLSAGPSIEDWLPVTLNGAPILIVSWAIAGCSKSEPEATAKPAAMADLSTILLVDVMRSFLFGHGGSARQSVRTTIHDPQQLRSDGRS